MILNKTNFLFPKFQKFKKPWTPVGQKSCLVTKDMRKQHKLHKQLSPLVQRMLNSYSDSNANNDKKGCQGNAMNKVVSILVKLNMNATNRFIYDNLT